MANAPDERPQTALPRTVLVLNEVFYSHGGRYYCDCDSHWWRFAGRLAEYSRDLTLYVPLAQTAPRGAAVEVSPGRMKIEGRFFYKRIEEYYARIIGRRRRMHRQAARLFADADLVLLRVPSPDALPLARVAWRLGKPTVLFVGGDVVSGTAYAEARGLKAVVARWMARRIRQAELRIAARSLLVAVWGNGLLPQFSRVNPQTVVAASPHISVEEIWRRPDTAQGDTITLVRVGSCLRTKGMEYLLPAVAALRHRGRRVRLEVIGAPDDPAYYQELCDLSHRLGLDDCVTWRGYVKFGPDLFDFYRAADIHVVSSISEGVPRCIAEGRAFGLPTVATRVGGIPSIVRDGADGLLVEPKNAEALAAAVERLIDDGDLRRQIIREGYRLAETETAEFQARRLATLIDRALHGQPLGAAAADLHAI